MGNDFEFLEENPPEMEDFGLDFSIYERIKNKKYFYSNKLEEYKNELNIFKNDKLKIYDDIINQKQKEVDKVSSEIGLIEKQIFNRFILFCHLSMIMSY